LFANVTIQTRKIVNPSVEIGAAWFAGSFEHVSLHEIQVEIPVIVVIEKCSAGALPRLRRRQVGPFSFRLRVN